MKILEFLCLAIATIGEAINASPGDDVETCSHYSVPLALVLLSPILLLILKYELSSELDLLKLDQSLLFNASSRLSSKRTHFGHLLKTHLIQMLNLHYLA